MAVLRQWSAHQSCTTCAAQEISSAGIETCGIGIKDQTVRHYYDRAFVIHSLEQLGTTMLGELKRVLVG